MQTEGRSEEGVSQSVSQPSEEFSFEDAAQPFQLANATRPMSMEEGSSAGEERGGEREGEEEIEEEEEDALMYSEEDLEGRTEAVWVALSENEREVGEEGVSDA